jgi:hypothetical protein
MLIKDLTTETLATEVRSQSTQSFLSFLSVLCVSVFVSGLLLPEHTLCLA